MLEHIVIEGVRNLSAVKIELAPGATALFGANGSGKTSFLEAVHLLGAGRSFRTHQSKPMIQHGMDQCRVVGRVKQSGHTLTMGIEKHRDGTVRARVDGENTSSLSELAQHLPLILLDTDGLGVVTGPPEGRRRLLDGTLFHVEQGFLSLWRRYAQTVRQRNSGLRRGILDSDKAWRHELAETGELLTELRAHAAAQFAEKLIEMAPTLSADLAGLEVVFRRGWDRSQTLLQALERNAESDAAQGFTQVGPHRADLRLMREGVVASEVLSRGQMKLTLVALKLVQGRLIEEVSAAAPLYLVDDLPAELDRTHCANVCEQLGSGRQVVLTAVDRTSLEAAWGESPLSLFHVEQGQMIAG
jgi:DNA replication and repair protein RecF